jgi:hypothetical protein
MVAMFGVDAFGKRMMVSRISYMKEVPREDQRNIC